MAGGGRERTGGSGRGFAGGEVWCWWRHPTGAEGAKEGTRAFICIDRTWGGQESRPSPSALRPGKSIQSKMETLGSAASSQPTAGQRFSVVCKCQVPRRACLNNQTTRGSPAARPGSRESRWPLASVQCLQSGRIRAAVCGESETGQRPQAQNVPHARPLGCCAIDKSGHEPTTVAKVSDGLVSVPHHCSPPVTTGGVMESP